MSSAAADAAILDAAARLLSSDSGASMSNIAAAAGSSRATLYRRFQTRKQLLCALRESATREAIDRLDDAALDAVGVEEGVERAVRALLAVGEKYVVLTVTRLAPTRSGVDWVAPALVDLIRRGRTDGRIRDDVPLGWLIESLIALTAAAVRTRAKQGIGLEDAAATVTRAFLQGASARRSRGGSGAPALAAARR